MSAPTDNNISIKEYNKISNCKHLEIEIEKMWRFNTTTVPIIVGALGMIKKGTDRHINKKPSCLRLYEIFFKCTLLNKTKIE